MCVCVHERERARERKYQHGTGRLWLVPISFCLAHCQRPSPLETRQLILYVCMCTWERESERERESASTSMVQGGCGWYLFPSAWHTVRGPNCWEHVSWFVCVCVCVCVCVWERERECKYQQWYKEAVAGTSFLLPGTLSEALTTRNTSVCVCVCVYVCERERERESASTSSGTRRLWLVPPSFCLAHCQRP